MAKRTTAAVWVKGIAELLAAEGLDVPSLFAAAGIDPAALEGPSARLQTEKISHLWELAVERSRNPMIALAQPHVVRPASFDVVGYTMMSCADLSGAFEQFQHRTMGVRVDLGWDPLAITCGPMPGHRR